MMRAKRITTSCLKPKNGLFSVMRMHTWFSASNTTSFDGVTSIWLFADTASTPAASDVQLPAAEITRTVTPSGSVLPPSSSTVTVCCCACTSVVKDMAFRRYTVTLKYSLPAGMMWYAEDAPNSENW